MNILKPAIFAAACLAAAPAALAERTAAEQANLDTVVAFYNTMLNDKDAEKAKSYLGDVYIQHNPAAKDGAEGMVGFIGYLKSSFPENRSDIKHSYVDGDTVVLHVHTKRKPEDLGNATIDIFRLEDGKIVEHWDAIQPVPETAQNDNTMF